MGDAHRLEAAVVIGAGGHGREIVWTLNRVREGSCRGIHDDQRPDEELLRKVGTTWMGPVPERIDAPAYLGIGKSSVRALVAERLEASTPPLVDPMTAVGPDVEMADGVVIFAMATVTTNVSLSQHVHIGRNASIGHDSEIGAFTTVMPGAVVGGHVRLGEATFIGKNATICKFVTIGSGVTVPTGAVVTQDLPDGYQFS